MKDILLVTPPFTQLNTPYPATMYLKGFLNTKNISSYQIDLGIETIVAIFSEKGLQDIFDNVEKIGLKSKNSQRIFGLRYEYIKTIEPVVRFLQNKTPTLARQICSGFFLPEASRFQQIDDLEWAFGSMGLIDKAKHLATLYLEDIADFIIECIDPDFGFSRYAEQIGRSANSFDNLYQKLQQDLSFVDSYSVEIFSKYIQEHSPKLVCFTVPFPGNLYSAFRLAQFVKQKYPNIKTAMGGGFANTELRSLKEKRVFEFFDFISLDDGELPIELIFENCIDPTKKDFKRTYTLENNQVIYINNSERKDYKQSEVGTPDYEDLKLDQYLSVIEITNPMHSLWTDGRWNKLTMAHGCYWGKCTFCDISLDYIKIYEPIAAKIIVDRMETIIAQTHENSFHFVDEAAPPALMREVALEIIKRNLIVSWWTNIRFEKSFTADLCLLLKYSGCIAVSGGLEVASDRLLDLIKKGVTVAQVAQVTKNFTEAGIMVHAYLMYGYPTQTVQETIDSLEMVRQMFEIGILQSGFWHQFAMTAHSPVGLMPEAFGVVPIENKITFAHNDIEFTDKTNIDHNKFSFGLKKSLYNFMHGLCFEFELQEWFDFKIPKTKIANDFIAKSLENTDFKINTNSKVIWLGEQPIVSENIIKKKNLILKQIIIQTKNNSITATIEANQADWFLNQIEKISVFNDKKTTIGALKLDFEQLFDDFELFWFSKNMINIRNCGVLLVV